MKVIKSKGKGFTLIEIMVASVIGAFIAVVAVGTLRGVSAISEKVNDNIDKASEIRFASKRIASDLVNMYRDRDFSKTKFVGTIETGMGGEFVSLKFYTVSRSKARPGQIEGDVYEVEYYLSKNKEGSQLMRRLQPNPDKDSEPGGILTAIANDIEMFGVRYFDGQEWQSEWDEKKKTLPELVEVTIGAKSSSKEQAIMESFFVNFARSSGGQPEIFEAGEEKEETGQ